MFKKYVRAGEYKLFQVAHWVRTKPAEIMALFFPSGRAVDLYSRRGIEGAVWNVLTLLAIGGIAVTMLFVLGPVILARAQTAVNRLSAAPGW